MIFGWRGDDNIYPEAPFNFQSNKKPLHIVVVILSTF